MLSRLSFQARLILMMCISLGLFAVLGGTGLVAVGKVNQSLDRIYQENMVPITLLERVHTNLNDCRTQLLLAMQHSPLRSFWSCTITPSSSTSTQFCVAGRVMMSFGAGLMPSSCPVATGSNMSSCVT